MELKPQDPWIKDIAITMGVGERDDHADAAEAGRSRHAAPGQDHESHHFALDAILDAFARAANTKALKVAVTR